MSSIRRREFIALVGGATAAWPLAARAQQADRMRRIGVLGNTSESAENLRQALRELGWVEGQNVTIEWRWAAGRPDQLPALAAELTGLHPDLIITITHRVALVAKKTTATIPIVFTSVNDPVGVGLVPSLARPGSNLTGVSLQGLDLIGKRLQLLQELVPRFARVAYLTNPTEPYSPTYLSEVQASANLLGLTQVLSVEVRATEEFASAFANLERERPDALLVEPNSVNFENRKRIADFVSGHKLPDMYGERRLMDRGLMSYGPNLSDHFRRAAVHVDKILKGAKPADLPVEQPTRFELVPRQSVMLGLSWLGAAACNTVT